MSGGKHREGSLPHQEITASVSLGERQAQIRKITSPLPGSVPYNNSRPLNVPARYAGETLIAFLCSWHPQIDRTVWLQKIADCHIIPIPQAPPDNRVQPLPLNPLRRVRPGERFEHLLPDTVEPDVSADIALLYEDDQFVVVNKPAPLPLHPGGRFNRNTLQSFLNTVYAPQRLLPAHRLDANTTGVLLFCRHRSVATIIQKQFEERTVRKTYFARVHGHPQASDFRCTAKISREPRAGGVREITDEGLEASTMFEVAERLSDGTSLIRVTPLTGRTNQIRLHLWHLGLPIVNDPVWLPNGKTAENRTQSVNEPCLCLHAAQLIFHNADGESESFTAPAPDWWEANVESAEEDLP